MARNRPLLFQSFPDLEGKVPWIPLGNLPTPVKKLERLEQALKFDGIWIKQDDLSGEQYGGNKIRKLEFVIADALKKRKDLIMTFGGIGSNHALATTVLAKQCDLRTILVLVDQPLTEHVQEQLLLFDHFGAKLSYAKNTAGVIIKGLYHLITKRPYFLWVGGSSPLGTLGFVNAGLELAAQVEEGSLPEPSQIFVPLGSMGTGAGLIVGFALAELDTDLVCVRVTDASMTDEKKTAKLCNRAIKLLRSASRNVPDLHFQPEDINVIHDFAGPRYGSVTNKSVQAIKLAAETENLNLETTYTGKAFACMLDHIRNQTVSGGPVLFWNTYNSVNLKPIVKENHDYTKLPKSFHKFFRENLISYI